ncbi:MAG: hypothetical protein MI923_03250 [Phycisphaerales bacterium]|nr:hypothetical protein [Phycisphaerales bacterium]
MGRTQIDAGAAGVVQEDTVGRAVAGHTLERHVVGRAVDVDGPANGRIDRVVGPRDVDRTAAGGADASPAGGVDVEPAVEVDRTAGVVDQDNAGRPAGARRHHAVEVDGPSALLVDPDCACWPIMHDGAVIGDVAGGAAVDVEGDKADRAGDAGVRTEGEGAVRVVQDVDAGADAVQRRRVVEVVGPVGVVEMKTRAAVVENPAVVEGQGAGVVAVDDRNDRMTRRGLQEVTVVGDADRPAVDQERTSVRPVDQGGLDIDHAVDFLQGDAGRGAVPVRQSCQGHVGRQWIEEHRLTVERIDCAGVGDQIEGRRSSGLGVDLQTDTVDVGDH